VTHLLTFLLILVILGFGIGGWLFLSQTVTSTQNSSAVQAAPSPTATTKPLSLEEETAKLCGPIDENLLGIKKSDLINVEHLLWAQVVITLPSQ
jgi:uncharacterized protein HemX